MVTRTKINLVDLNSLLMVSNLIILFLSLIAFTFAQGNRYINQETFALGVILCMQTHIALFVERKRRDPFVILLAYVIIFYYSLRILTLALYPFSVVFERFPSSVNPDNLNFSLLFMIIANAFLYAGFYVKNFDSNRIVQVGRWRATSTGRTIFLLATVIVIAYTRSSYWNETNISRLFVFLTIFISQSTIIMMVFAYLYLYHKSISRISFVILVGLILSEAVIHTLTGSRAAVLALVQAVILSNLAIYGCMKIRRAHVGVSLAVLPLAAILLAASFAMSTIIRTDKSEGKTIDIVRVVELGIESLGKEADLLTTLASSSAVLLPPVFDRLGYLDYSAEIIANSERYATVINTPAYARSVVDNLLTPGFDVFDQARISYALQSVYNPYFSGEALKSRVEENYQSDQLGLYAEMYMLFGGYLSIPLFFAIAYLVKRIFVGLTSANPVVLTFKRNVVFIAFFMIINSYGFDWMLIEITPIAVSILLFKYFFPSARRRMLSPPSVCGTSSEVPGALGRAINSNSGVSLNEGGKI